MTMKNFLWLYLLVHLLFCLLIYIGIRTRILKFSEQVFPIVLLVPMFGVLAAVIADYNSRFHKLGIRPISLEELHLPLEDLRLTRLEGDDRQNAVIPLEEAMSINDAETRRKLMLEILHQNPDEYISLLQEARLDDDIEVTHYASTAIMETQREYELSLQKAGRAYDEDPENDERLDRYLKNLQRYIDSGLIDESVLFVYRNRYTELLKEKMRRSPEEMDLYLQAVDNFLAVGNYSDALLLGDTLVRRWSNSEKAWLTRLKICQRMNDGAGIRSAIDEIRRRNVYLTPEGRGVLAFWDRNRENREPDGEEGADYGKHV